jgi:hypothetical protein
MLTPIWAGPMDELLSSAIARVEKAKTFPWNIVSP